MPQNTRMLIIKCLFWGLIGCTIGFLLERKEPTLKKNYKCCIKNDMYDPPCLKIRSMEFPKIQDMTFNNTSHKMVCSEVKE